MANMFYQPVLDIINKLIFFKY